MQQQSPVEADSRTLIVVAEREQVPEPGSGLMDLAVLGYRLRWRVAGWWVLLFAGSVMLMPLGSGFKWRLTVQVQNQNQNQNQNLEPLLLEWLAVGDGAGGLQVEYLKFGSGSKTEMLRQGVIAMMGSNSSTVPPEGLVVLRSVAEEWCARQRARWGELQADTIALAIKRRDAILTDTPKGTNPVELAAAELAVAQAESAARFPPEYRVSAMECQEQSSGAARALAQRAALCLVGSIAIALALHGWSRVRAAARSQPG